MTNQLVIAFIDALPFADAQRYIPGLSWKPMIPSLGYSLNIKAEMFAGLSADDWGIFNEFQLENPRGSARAWALLSPLDRYVTISWFVRRVASRIGRVQLNNIPFRYRAEFARRGVNAYERTFDRPSALDTPGIAKILYSEAPSRTARDRWVASELLRRIDAGDKKIFAAFPDLDHDLHAYGFGSTEVTRDLEFYEDLVARLQRKNVSVVVCSDHGMCDVRGSLDVMSKLQATAFGSKMRFFIDSTIVRVWNPSRPQTDELMSLFDSLGITTLTEADRAILRLASRGFGDLIAVAPEHAVFSPNFYGRGVPKAMHGYLPHLPSQWGAVGAELTEESDATLPDSFTPTMFHELLRRLVRM